MIGYILPVIILLISLGYIFLVVRPKKKLLWYKNVYQSLGYKVKVLDFRILKIGSIHQWMQWSEKYDDIWYMPKTQEFINYDVVLNYMLTGVEIFLNNPQLIKDWLSPENFSKYEKYTLLAENLRRLVGGNGGLLFSQGDIWKKKRKSITKALNHELVKDNIPRIKSICEEVFDQFQENFQLKHPQRKDELEACIGDICLQIFSKIVLRIFLGSNVKNAKLDGINLSNFVVKLIADTNQQSQSSIGLILGRWIHNIGLTARDRDINRRMKLLRQFSLDIVNKKIEQVKQKGFKNDSCDLIEGLLNQQSKENASKPIQQRFKPEELIQQLLVFLMAATDTSSSLTKIMIYYIARNPNVEKRLREEIDKHIKTDSDFSWDILKQIQYIDWIQNQGLRLSGPANSFFMRVAKQDNKICNLPVKKGDCVNYMAVSNHYNQKIYKNAQQFIPQRWESDCNNIHPFAFLAFSSGPRSCVGKSLALIESKIALIIFMKRYHQIEPLTDKIRYYLTLVYQSKDFNTKMKKVK